MKKFAFAAALGALAVAAAAQPYYGTWNRFRTLSLNTTASGGGANVQGAVANFPLLVRLSSTSVATGANILAEALANGADIRFTDSTGTVPLAYQIDSWSATSAAIWVKVPNVAANGTTKVRIWWNKAGAVDSSRGASVFDTAAGYTGVWHLEQGGAGNVIDATPNGLNFTGHASVRAVDGLIGKARYYNEGQGGGDEYYVDESPNNAKFQASGAATKISISAWVNRRAPGSSASQGVFGQFRYSAGAYRSYALMRNAEGNFNVLTSVNGSGDTRRVSTSATWPDMEWVHVVTTIDPSTAPVVKIYVNGQQQATTGTNTTGTDAAVYAVTASQGMPLIGALERAYQQNTESYIDELQFSNGTVRDSNWVKLSYQTQKPGATALTLGGTESPVARALFYPLKSASYKRNVAILANDPVVQGTATSYALTNLAGTTVTLPAGLTFSATTGQIAGTPTAVTASAQYVVTVNLQGGGTGKDTLTIGVIPGDVPGAPGAPTGVLGPLSSGIDTVKWAAPSNTGSSPISAYKVIAVQDTTKSCTTTGALSCVVTGLNNSVSYSFQVRAINAEGPGPLSPASSLVVPPSVPGAPPAISGLPGSAIGSIDVYWNAPANGGLTITSYKIMAVQDTSKSCTWTTGSLMCRVTGLTGGQSYTFQARAYNALGGGPLSGVSVSVVAPSTGTAIQPGSFVVRMAGDSKPFTFVLPASDVASTDEMTMAVSDVWGRTVWSKTVQPARHGRELTWNGKASNGRAVSAGMYVVRVSLLSGGKKVELSEKTISIKP